MKSSQKKSKKQTGAALQAQASKAEQPKKPAPWWFYLVAISLPLFFLLLLEVGLRAADYGRDYTVFVPSSRDSNKLTLNPYIGYKYFRTTEPPAVIPVEFDRVKAPNSLRVFVFGESSVAGYPYPYSVSFPAYVQRALEMQYPSRKVEVINLGMAAICTETIKDFFAAALEQKPDVLVFYNGHNEYYGVMGAASSIRFSGVGSIQSLLLSMQDSRLVQLVQNGLATFTKPSKNENATLMAKVIGESAIPLGSKTYDNGLRQFRENMSDMLSVAQKKNIPVVIGTLASNQNGQKPFVSLARSDGKTAQAIFEEAAEQLAAGDSVLAKRLFLEAKDLDGLRFRAPEAMNRIIDSLAQQYGCTIARVSEEFAAASPQGIVGNNLMCDHLHPTVKGYQVMGRVFASTLIKVLPPSASSVPMHFIDQLILSQLPFSKLDSTIADMRLRILMGTYPFVPAGEPNRLISSYPFRNHIDTLSAKAIDEQIAIYDAHLEAAEFYLYEKNEPAAFLEFKSLIAKYPNYERFYRDAGQAYLKFGYHAKARNCFLDAYSLKKTAFAAGAIGQIDVFNQDFAKAIPFLEESIALGNTEDASLYYNLSGAYFYTGQREKAIAAIQRALQLRPNYPAARAFLSEIQSGQ
ncbi:MAG: tetratricopeptide repeat protein [Chloroherpetonaceae bacterium]|nr:tetratricopeptide repeat protein [Chloroherpetonaceae bacterium]